MVLPTLQVHSTAWHPTSPPVRSPLVLPAQPQYAAQQVAWQVVDGGRHAVGWWTGEGQG